MTEVAELRRAVILDDPSIPGRRIAETIEGAGFSPAPVASLVEVGSALAAGVAPVAVIAFEALFPLPQRVLADLRRAAPRACIVVAHAEDSLRVRLGERLWAMSLMDYFVPRSSPPHVLTPILRQAHADWLLEREEAPAIDTAATSIMRRLTHLGASLLSQRSVLGILRVLHAKLHAFIPYDVLLVLTTDKNPLEAHVFQRHAVDHEVVWALADAACRAASAFLADPIESSQIELIEGAPVAIMSDEPTLSAPPGGGSLVTFPLVVGGQFLGVLAMRMMVDAERAERHQPALRLVSQQLAGAVRCAVAIADSEQASLTDELTGAFNRRHLRHILEEEWARTNRYGLELSVAVLDLDLFKQINDTHGHLAGDRALRLLAQEIMANLRETDALARYGGDEFVLVLPQTGAANAAHVIERMRGRIAGTAFPVADTTVSVSFSAGVACYPNVDVNSIEELLEKADEALLSAKRAGRGQVHVSSSVKDLLDEITEVAYGVPDQRRYRRMRVAEPVSCLPVLELDATALPLKAVDISEGGVQVDGLEQPLAIDRHVLVYFAGASLPRLAQVVWSRPSEHGHRAGLRFVNEADLKLPRAETSAPPAPPPKALVVVHHPVVRDIAERVLTATRYESTIVDDETQLDFAELADLNLLVIGESALRAEFGRRLQAEKDKLSPHLRIVLLNETATRRDILDTVSRHHLEHLVAKDTNQEEALFTTLSKLLLGSYFGIRKYLLWGATTRTWQIANAEQKQALFDELRLLAAAAHCHPRIIDLLVAAVDEMVINALYLEKDPSRQRPVTVEYGSDGRLIAVAVIDPYGTFEPTELYRALGRSLEQEEQGMPPDEEHGNLGFRTMLMALSHLVVNVEAGRRTELIGLVDLRKSLRDYRRTAPSLGVFSTKTS